MAYPHLCLARRRTHSFICSQEQFAEEDLHSDQYKLWHSHSSAACCLIAGFFCSLKRTFAAYRARIGAACRPPHLAGGGRILLNSQGLYLTPIEFQSACPALQLLQQSSRYDLATYTAASVVQKTLLFPEQVAQ